ncbi:MAG: hypothetical protein JWP27_1477 [Flaviaesturariibacter sp.]|nr:hypothetical protein [Flaviaesturariibacter sp.]
MVKDDLIPGQDGGAQSNTEASKTFENVAKAQEFFKDVCGRLRHVNRWHDIAGALSAEFQLTDADGQPVDRPVEKGDYFRIDIPGPGTRAGDGYDWVQVESVDEVADEEEEALSIRVRPAPAPVNPNPDVAHFFSPEATSCFQVRRQGNHVIAAVYGRNEKPNTDAGKLVDKARNVAVATGAITGAAKLQWKSLVEGMIGNRGS